jgi:hypothetical protein
VLRAARLHRARGAAEPALRRIGALLKVDPLDETALRLQLEVLSAAGRRADALKSYVRFTERLAAELGLEPEPETVALIEEINRGARTQPAEERATGTTPPHNLPAAMSSFVGRSDQVSTLRAVLSRDEVRGVSCPPALAAPGRAGRRPRQGAGIGGGSPLRRPGTGGPAGVPADRGQCERRGRHLQEA